MATFQIAFILDNISDYDTLVSGMGDDVTVFVLESSSNVLEQIASIVAGYTHLDAIHLFSHANSGVLNLGNITLTSENLNDYGMLLSQIGSSLGENGDILLYGCNVAADQNGIDFIGRLAQATGADIAASDDLTGSSSLGGDWIFEAHEGTIEAGVIVSDLLQQSYGYTLATSENFDSRTVAQSNSTSATYGSFTFTADGSANIAITDSADLTSGSDYSLIFNSTYAGNVTSSSFKTADGTEFKLNSFAIADLGTTNNVTITGKIDGSIAKTATINLTSNNSSNGATYTKVFAQGATFGSNYGTITFSGWDNIDELVITGASGLAIELDDISVSAAVVPPIVTDAKISITSIGSGTAGAYKIGDTVTAIWDNTASGDNNAGITGVTMDFSAFGGGSAVAATNSSGTWTATYTVVAGAIDGTNKNVSVTASNTSGSTTTADSTNATVDNIAPTVTDSKISISGGSGASGAYKIGDTVTATWNNTAGGDNNTDTISGVTVDFSQFGGGSAVAATNSSGTWTATYTIAAGAIDGTNKNISVTATDNAGNTTTTVDSTNATVDNIAPTVTDSKISISGGSGASGAYKIGDTVTATWNNTAGGDNNTDTISGVTVDFSQFGGGSAVAATNSSGTWTATYTIAAGAIDGTNKNISVTATDNAGNTTTTVDSTNATVDNIAPIVTDANISISGASGVGGAYKIGDTVTATWNNTAGGNNNTDTISGVTVDFSQFGGGSAVAATNSSGTWTATYTIAAGAIDGTNKNISVTATDNAGNTKTTVDSTNATVDNIAPVISSVSLPNSTMKVGDTVTATITVADDGGKTYTGLSGSIDGYSLGSLARVDSTTYTAQFTVTNGGTDVAAGSNIPVNIILQDNVGNTSASYTTAISQNSDPIYANYPTVTSTTYDYTTNSLVVSGTNFIDNSGGADIDVTKLTLTGEGGASYTLTAATSNVERDSVTQFTVALGGADIYNVERLLNKDGTTSATGGSNFYLSLADDYVTILTSGDTSDANNTVTVSNYTSPVITSSTYDASTGQLVITGTNFVNASGANNDLVASMLTLLGEGNSSYTLTDTANVEITSDTSATLTLSATDKLNINGLLNKNGTSSGNATIYNLAAADNWLSGAPASTNISDLTGNGITVSNVQVPVISSATYDSDTGVLAVTGTNLFKKAGASNDIDISTLTLTGGTSNQTYTIISSSDIEITSATSFSITLSGSDKTNVDTLLDKIGTISNGNSTYNLAAADNWLAGADNATDISDGSNPVTVSISPKITSATYDASTGSLVVTGTNIQANGGGADIDASMFTFTGEGGAAYTLTDTADVEIGSATAFTLSLSATDKAAINQMMNKNGTISTGGTTFNLGAADNWNTQVTAGDTSDTTGNAITVSNVAAPTISSATYDAGSGALVVSGTGFLKLNGGTNDIDVSKLTLTGEGGSTYTLTSSSIEITNGTSFTVNVNATDKAAINQMMNKNGISSTGNTTYNLAAAEDWAAGAAASAVVADLTSNAITVSNVATPTITSATYHTGTGVLVVTGTNFLKYTGATNDIDLSKLTFTGQGGGTFTLTTATDVEITSGTSFTATLSGSDKTGVNALLNKNGLSSNDNTTYNLAAAEDWAMGADAAVVVADTASNGITVTLNQAPVITSNGGGATAAINVAENSTAVTTVTSTDAESNTISYSITGGADQSKFSINTSTGILSFASAPDYETPSDSDANNSYIVDITANDGNGGTDVQTITVSVTDVVETAPTTSTTTTQTIDGATVTTSTTTNSTGTATTQVTITPTGTTWTNQTGSTTTADIPMFWSNSDHTSTATTLSIPTGVGVTATGILSPKAGTTASSAISDMSSLVNQALSTVSLSKQGILDGIASFFNGLGTAIQNTILNHINFSLTSVIPATPVTIEGIVPSSGQITPQEALLFTLPTGMTINLNNVEFAVINGSNIAVRGGSGSNVVFGGDGRQDIVCGADDDELHGGEGNDIVGSLGGDDLLYGDAGDDLVVGGIGNDTLYGGEGNDLLQGGQSDAGTWHFSISQDHVKGTFDAKYTAMSDIAQMSFTSWVNEQGDAITDDNRVSFTSNDVQRVEDIAMLYHAVTGSLASVEELNYWVNGDQSVNDLLKVAYDFYDANEGKGLSLEAKVASLIEKVFGTADDVLAASGVQFIQNGGTWEAGLQYLSHHSNHTAHMLDGDNNLQLAKEWIRSETGWSSDIGNDTLYGGAGNDVLVGGRGNDLLDGGEGIDLAAFVGNIDNYTLKVIDGTVKMTYILTGETKVLKDIEMLQFGSDIYGVDPELYINSSMDTAAVSQFVHNATQEEISLIGIQDWAA